MRIACWQPESVGSGPELIARLRLNAETAAGSGAELLITPELSLTGYALDAPGLAQAADPVDGPLGAAMARLAADCGIAVLYGWPESADGVVYNTSQLIDRHGDVVAHYRKTHLCGELETAAFVPGYQPLIQANIGGLTVGLLICYDVEFPEMARLHALAGTQLLAVPTALTRPWEIVPRTLIPARAFESQLYLAYVNWADARPDGFCGLTRVVGPDGSVLVADETAAPEALLLADLGLTAIASARRATGYLRDRRPELYAGLS